MSWISLGLAGCASLNKGGSTSPELSLRTRYKQEIKGKYAFDVDKLLPIEPPVLRKRVVPIPPTAPEAVHKLAIVTPRPQFSSNAAWIDGTWRRTSRPPLIVVDHPMMNGNGRVVYHQSFFVYPAASRELPAEGDSVRVLVVATGAFACETDHGTVERLPLCREIPEPTFEQYRNLVESQRAIVHKTKMVNLLAQPTEGDQLQDSQHRLEFPPPSLIFLGTESSTSAEGSFVRYRMRVSNRDDYPDELFEKMPHFDQEGIFFPTSRTWLDIYADDRRVLSSAALKRAENLNTIWFEIRQGDPIPAVAQVVLRDRKTNKSYESNKLAISIPIQSFAPDSSISK